MLIRLFFALSFVLTSFTVGAKVLLLENLNMPAGYKIAVYAEVPNAR